MLNATNPTYISDQMENAYPAGVSRVGYFAEIAAVSVPSRPVAANQLKTMTPMVAASTRNDLIRSVPVGVFSMLLS